MDGIQNIHIHKHKSEQKLVRCEINTKEKVQQKSTKSSPVVVLGPDKRGMDEEIMRLVKSNESDIGSETKQTNRLTSKTKQM